MRRPLAILASLLLFACSRTDAETTASDTPPGEYVRSSKPRLTTSVPAADTQELTTGNAAFALDVLGRAAGKDDFFFSPHSISIALGMTYAGARGETAAQMAKALHFTLPPERLHPAFGSLDLAIASRATAKVDSGQAFRLDVLNAIWGQRGYAFLSPFLDTLAENYGAGLSLLDFTGNTEGARTTINGWVSQKTEAKIPELLSPGILTSATVLVLTNAIYFKASWALPFEPSATQDGSFTKLDGTTQTAPLMHQSKEHRYAEGPGWQAVDLTYAGDDVSMLVVLPEKGRFEEIRGKLDLAAITGALGGKLVDVTLPRFTFRTKLGVKPTLQALGMNDAFQGGVADFSGMDGTRSLYIQDVVHEAFVAVDEEGTEAAAATAVVVGRTSVPERATFTADRPFLVFVRDAPTGAILFAGQVTSI